MGCRLAGGLSLDQESCDNHASHPLLPPPRLCLAPHPVPLASDYVGTEEKVSSAHCRTRSKEGWDVDGICYDAFHLPLDSFPQFKSRALILPPIPAPQMQAWWWNEYGVCVCVSEGETRSLVSSLLLSECTGNLWLCHPGHARSRLSVQGRRGSGSPRLVWLSTILSWKID